MERVRLSDFRFVDTPVSITAVGDLFTLKAGKFIKASEISAVGGYPVYGGHGIRGYTSTYNHDGDYPLIGRQGALCGNVQIAHGKFYATEHAVAVSCNENTDVRWSYYALKALNLNQYATATAQPGLAVKNLLPLPISVPDMADQQRIASLCDVFYDALESLRKVVQAF